MSEKRFLLISLSCDGKASKKENKNRFPFCLTKLTWLDEERKGEAISAHQAAEP